MNELYASTAVVLVAVAGVGLSNFLFDNEAPDSIPRRAAHVLGGVAYLIAVLWLPPVTAVALSSMLALLVIGLRLGFPDSLRGLRRSVSTGDWAEIAYPLAATASLSIGWGLLGDKWLAFLPIGFMAWGDSVAGLVRAVVRRGRIAVLLPSMTMLGVCLLVATVYQPYWIGALGAITATGGERFRLIAHRFWDENWVPDDPVIVAGSLAVMGVLASSGL